MRYDVHAVLIMEYSFVEEADSAIDAQAAALAKVDSASPQATDIQVKVSQGVL